MRQLSLWAKHHAVQARIIITFIHVLLVITACYLAKNIGVLPVELVYSCLFLLLVILIIYPLKGKKLWFIINKYTFKKTCDLLSAICFFILVYWFAGNNFQLPFYNSNVSATVEKPKEEKPTAQSVLKSLKYRAKSTLTRKEKVILRKEFKKQTGLYAKATIKQDKPAQANAAVIIAAIVVAVGLIFLLAGLACSISCNGSGALAIGVFALGTAGIILGAIAIINGSKRHRQKKLSGK